MTSGDTELRTRLLESGYCVVAEVLPPPLLAGLRQVTGALLTAQSPEQRERHRAQRSVRGEQNMQCLMIPRDGEDGYCRA